MRWQSALAIYLLFWVLSAFLVLPFGMRTAEEAGHAHVPGQASGAGLGRGLSGAAAVTAQVSRHSPTVLLASELVVDATARNTANATRMEPKALRQR